MTVVMEDLATRREQMVERQLASRGIRDPLRETVCRELSEPWLERAIGVIYRPETELMSHSLQAILPRQLDESVWVDATRAVTPLGREARKEMPDTFPFGL